MKQIKESLIIHCRVFSLIMRLVFFLFFRKLKRLFMHCFNPQDQAKRSNMESSGVRMIDPPDFSSSVQLHQVSNGHQIPSVLQFHEHLYWPSSRSVLAWRWPAGKGVVFWRSVMNKKVMHESVLANHYTAVGEKSKTQISTLPVLSQLQTRDILPRCAMSIWIALTFKKKGTDL